jgi:hypothetical protein
MQRRYFNAISFEMTGDVLLNFDDASLNKNWATLIDSF